MHILTRPAVPVRFGADSAQSRPTSSHRAAHEVEAGPSALNREGTPPPPYSYSENGEDLFQRQAPAERPELPAESVARHELPGDRVERPELPAESVARHELPGERVARHELPGERVARHELPGERVARHELPGERVARHELPGERVARYELPGERGSTESSNAQTSNQDVEANGPNQRPEQPWAKKNWKKLAAVGGTLLAGAIVAGPVGIKLSNTNKNDSTPDSPSTTTDPTTTSAEPDVTCTVPLVGNADAQYFVCNDPTSTWQERVECLPATIKPNDPIPYSDVFLLPCPTTTRNPLIKPRPQTRTLTITPDPKLGLGTLTKTLTITPDPKIRIGESDDPEIGIGESESTSDPDVVIDKREEMKTDAHDKPTRTTSPKPIITGKRPEKKAKLEDQD